MPSSQSQQTDDTFPNDTLSSIHGKAVENLQSEVTVEKNDTPERGSWSNKVSEISNKKTQSREIKMSHQKQLNRKLKANRKVFSHKLRFEC